MDEYVYHITKKRVAFDKIKQQGLVPAARLSGSSVAMSEGAFASDRARGLEKKEISRLTETLWQGAKRGYTDDYIKNKNYPFTSIPVEAKGERDAEYTALTKFEENFLNGFFPPGTVKRPTPKMKDFVEQATVMLRDNPGHTLCRFAKEYTRLSYAIEEYMSSNHIYFFEMKNATSCFSSYTKHHGGAILCRVLRVKRNAIGHLEQDQAEEKGLLTRESIRPEFIEVYNSEGSPFDSSAKPEWNPLTEAKEIG